jgi:hypothetical protein
LTPPLPPPQPKEKPLRIKRGHRKPSAFPNLDATPSVNAATPGSTTFISQNLLVHSPSSDFSAAQGGDAAGSKTNGVHKGAPKKPGSAFDLYCAETRPSVKDKAKEGDNVEEELSRRWKDLPDDRRDEYQSRADSQMAEYEKEKDAYDAKAKEAASAKADADNKAESTESDRPAEGAGEGRTSRQQEDVEMTNYDTDQETQGEKLEE